MNNELRNTYLQSQSSKKEYEEEMRRLTHQLESVNTNLSSFTVRNNICESQLIHKQKQIDNFPYKVGELKKSKKNLNQKKFFFIEIETFANLM